VALHPSQIFLITSLSSSDCIGLLYSPAFLLDAGLDASITDGPDFSGACESGFEGFFEDTYEEDENGDEVFMGCSFIWRDVERMIAENVARGYSDFGEHFGYTSLSWRAGFMLGWLSALAFVNCVLALQGVDLLALLVRSCQREGMRMVA
jgi:hypothetical protein